MESDSTLPDNGRGSWTVVLSIILCYRVHRIYTLQMPVLKYLFLFPVTSLPTDADLKKEPSEILEAVKGKIRKLQVKHRSEIKKFIKIQRKLKPATIL